MSIDFSEQRAALDALRAELSELAEIEEPTSEQEARMDECVVEFEAAKADYDKSVERAAKLEEIRTAEIREFATPSASPEVLIRGERNLYDAGELRSLDPKTRGAEMRSRAVAAIECDSTRFEFVTDDQREQATKHAERSTGIAEHILAHGSPDYLDKFEQWVINPTSPSTRMGVEQAEGAELRAAMSNTDANGGYLSVPYVLDPTVILTNAGTANPYRAISTVKTIVGTDTWQGVSSAGVTAEWLGEGSQAADASPTFSNPSIVTAKAAAYLFASMEMEADSGVAGEIARLIADAKDHLESTAFTTGTGSSQPTGIVTALGLTTTSRVAGSSGAAGAADLVAADIFALDNDLGPRFRPGASFVGGKTTYNAIRRLANVNAGNNPASFWVDFGGALPPKLIGYNAYEASAFDTTIVSGSNDDVMVLGDFSNYVIVDRVGLAIAYNPLVVGANQRPTGQVGWFATWRVGANSVADAAFRMLRL